MGKIIIETETLRSLATDTKNAAAALGVAASVGADVFRAVDAAGVDGSAIVDTASRSRHLANGVAALGPPLVAVADWLDGVESHGGAITGLPSLPLLGLAAISAHPSLADVRVELDRVIGRDNLLPGAAAGMLPPSSDFPGHPVEYTTDPGALKWLGSWGPKGPESAYQCVAWANFRWYQLLYRGPNIPGNGGQMVPCAVKNHLLRELAVPTLGAMASYGGDPGHVMIVEEIKPGANLTFRVSEGNQLGINGGDGTPAEWGTSRWFQKDPHGWQQVLLDDKGKVIKRIGSVITDITFAAFPGT